MTANDVGAFFVEVLAIGLLGTWAWQRGPSLPLRLIWVVLVVGAAITLWGSFAAPKATFDLPAAAVAVKVLVLGGSVLAGFLLLPTRYAITWAVLVVANTALQYAGPWAR
ncbi:YrdB family protein [Calidifontibacter sp. DB0510]|uniref:YrdB family protein n=1 Tax=Metallococcus carri TaxID=1656884 RepID=A0A967B2J9_9MICO|nr:DUF2568 domain-containing protein [Metallococcus carri]NHN56842.1 YrdB family protein [Metallococcus carri]NOP37781.1 YrdB family protein [Calidifontibacter sp. DB2511S]